MTSGWCCGPIPARERLTDTGYTPMVGGQIEVIAEEVLTPRPSGLRSPEGIELNGHTCFAMMVGPRALGMVGILAPSGNLDIRRKTGAAAALLGDRAAERPALRRRARPQRQGRADRLLQPCVRARIPRRASWRDRAAAERRSRSSCSTSTTSNGSTIAHGHLCGDNVLAAVGQRLRQVLRRSDVRCRYGGDEFLLVLPDTGEAGAAACAEWLRGEIEQIAGQPRASACALTISAGTATVHAGESTGAALIDRADKALLSGEGAGRNCVRPGAGAHVAALASLLAPGDDHALRDGGQSTFRQDGRLPGNGVTLRRRCGHSEDVECPGLPLRTPDQAQITATRAAASPSPSRSSSASRSASSSAGSSTRSIRSGRSTSARSASCSCG